MLDRCSIIVPAMISNIYQSAIAAQKIFAGTAFPPRFNTTTLLQAVWVNQFLLEKARSSFWKIWMLLLSLSNRAIGRRLSQLTNNNCHFTVDRSKVNSSFLRVGLIKLVLSVHLYVHLSIKCFSDFNKIWFQVQVDEC